MSYLDLFETPVECLLDKVDRLIAKIGYCSQSLQMLDTEHKCTVMMLMAELIQEKDQVEDVI